MRKEERLLNGGLEEEDENIDQGCDDLEDKGAGQREVDVVEEMYDHMNTFD